MSNSIAESAKIFPNVTLGENVVVEDFCIIGAPPRGAEPGEMPTVIGDNAVIRSHTVIYAGNAIGSGLQTGNKANLRESNTIGDNVSVGTLSIIEHHVRIGNGVRIHGHVFIPEHCTLKEGCWIGPNVVFTNAKYPNRPETKKNLCGVVVESAAVVGANVTVLPGVRLGKACLVGAGSVVTKDVAPGATVKGNPAT